MSVLVTISVKKIDDEDDESELSSYANFGKSGGDSHKQKLYEDQPSVIHKLEKDDDLNQSSHDLVNLIKDIDLDTDTQRDTVKVGDNEMREVRKIIFLLINIRVWEWDSVSTRNLRIN